MTIIDKFLCYFFLEITYRAAGEEVDICSDRDETVSLLQDAGIIVYSNGMVLEDDQWIEYGDWIDGFELTEQDAIDIATIYELRRVQYATCQKIMKI